MRQLHQSELIHVSGGAGGCPQKGDRKMMGGDHKRNEHKMKQGNNGFGNGGKDGVPGNSNKSDDCR